MTNNEIIINQAIAHGIYTKAEAQAIVAAKGCLPMNNENMAVYPPYRLVAQFADGARLLFDGLTEAQAQQSMEAAQAQHGDIAWYDGVTDLHYENGKYYKLIPPPPEVTLIDLTEYTGPLDENGLPPSLTGNPPADHETGPNDHK